MLDGGETPTPSIPLNAQNPFFTLTEYESRHLFAHLLSAGDPRYQALLLDIDYLEMKAEKGWIFELIAEFRLAAASLTHEETSMLDILDRALRQNGGFIARHPTTLFQCLWNNCCWKDTATLQDFLVGTKGRAAFDDPHPSAIISLLSRWRARRAARLPAVQWVRSLRPSPADQDDRLKLILPLSERQGQPAILQFSPDSSTVVIWFCDYKGGKIVGGKPQAWECKSGREVA
jgi:hypothetical protein